MLRKYEAHFEYTDHGMFLIETATIFGWRYRYRTKLVPPGADLVCSDFPYRPKNNIDLRTKKESNDMIIPEHIADEGMRNYVVKMKRQYEKASAENKQLWAIIGKLLVEAMDTEAKAEDKPKQEPLCKTCKYADEELGECTYPAHSITFQTQPNIQDCTMYVKRVDEKPVDDVKPEEIHPGHDCLTCCWSGGKCFRNIGGYPNAEKCYGHYVSSYLRIVIRSYIHDERKKDMQ